MARANLAAATDCRARWTMDGETTVYFRPMVDSDVAQVRQLHDACLPFAYRDSFYARVLQNPEEQFALLAALKPRTLAHPDDVNGRGVDGSSRGSSRHDGDGTGVAAAAVQDEIIVAAITGQYNPNHSAADAAGRSREVNGGTESPTNARDDDLGGAAITGGTTLLYVQSLVVSSQHRRQGLGSHLLRRCVQDAMRR
jgi:ribosomal protein S18 acetylase RimI-like enzyme